MKSAGSREKSFRSSQKADLSRLTQLQDDLKTFLYGQHSDDTWMPRDGSDVTDSNDGDDVDGADPPGGGSAAIAST